MRKGILLAAVAATLLGVSSASAKSLSDRYGMYLSLSGAYTMPNGDVKLEDGEIDDVDVPDVKMSLDDGWAGIVAAGLNLGEFRAEGEIGYFHNDVNRVKVSSPLWVVDADYQDMVTFMVNGYYDFPIIQKLSGYVGVGAGVAVFGMSTDYTGPGGTADFDGWLGLLAVQGKVGLQYQITDRIYLTGGYRILGAFDATLDTDDLEGTWGLPVFQMFEVGLRFDL